MRISTSGDTYIQDGVAAVGATRREQVVVVGLAVWLALAFEEALCAEFAATVHAREAQRMEGLAERGHDLK